MPVDLGSFGESVPLDLPDLGSMPVKQPDPLPDITDHEELEMVCCQYISQPIMNIDLVDWRMREKKTKITNMIRYKT